MNLASFVKKCTSLQLLKKNLFWTNIRNLNSMDNSSRMAFIEKQPEDPVDLFVDLINAYKESNPEKPFIPMNIATTDDEFGVLNRTVVYRGLENRHIIFVTERNSSKYANLIKDPRTAVTFLFDKLEWNKVNSTWQVRLMGKAAELSADQISNLWTQEPIFAKIRSRISECGKPVNFEEHKNDHDRLLTQFENGKDSLPQTDTYTAFKILPIVWDFYKSETNCVADRVQYRKKLSQDDKWSIMHVAS